VNGGLSTRTGYDAVLVLSFGGPEGPEDVMPFLENVTRGRDVPTARLTEVAGHYERFGGVSPINGANRALVAALEAALVARGTPLPVYWGNRNWRPLVSDTLQQMTDDGVRRAVCFVTSAYSGYSSCRQYLEDIAGARAAVGPDAPVVDKLRAFFDHPGFIGPFVEATAAALERLDPAVRAGARLAFTAHSVPLAQADTSDYVAQLEEASRLVAAGVGGDHGHALVWQSRSGPAQVPWLEPDIGLHLEHLRAEGAAAVVIVPIGFIADHLEVVWDLDVEALTRAAELGLPATRAATPGTHPDFVAMVCELIGERLDPTAPRRSLGRLPARPAECRPGCCPPPTGRR
jgi:ferrochelatase